MRDIFRALGSQDQDPTVLMRQFAQLATNADSESNIDPGQRIQLEQLFSVAQLHVENSQYLPSNLASRRPTLRTHTAQSWAESTILQWEPYLSSLREAMAPPLMLGDLNPDSSSQAKEGLDFAQLIQGMAKTIGPTLSAAQLGSVIGHLGLEVLGSYEIPIPRSDAATIDLVPSNLFRFASEWQIGFDQVCLWMSIRELAHLSLLRVEHIRDRLDTQIRLHLVDMKADMSDVMQRFSSMEQFDPQTLQSMMIDPSNLLGTEMTEAQRLNYQDIGTTLAFLEAATSIATHEIGERVIGNTALLDEVLRRRRLELTETESMIGKLLGLEIAQEIYELALSFVQELRGRQALNSVTYTYSSVDAFPERHELESPGLWLARLEF